MQYSENYALRLPEYGDKAKVDDLNFNATKIDNLIKHDRDMTAPYFNQETDYVTGRIVQYNGELYKFIADKPAGNWDATKVEQTDLATEISQGGGSAEVTKEASGNPIELTDAASAPMVKCVTEIQGSQDLHGYDKPWVGGAGKNKCPVDISSFNGNSGTWYSLEGVVASDFLNGTVITLSPNTYYIQLYDVDGISNIQVFSPNGDVLVNEAYGGSFTIYTTENIYVRVKTDKTSIVCKIMLAIGSTASAWEPYSNICPISGYSSVGVDVAGKNLFDKTTYTFTSEKYVSLSTGNIGTNSSYACTESYIPCGNLAGQTITLNHIPGDNQPGMAFYDSDNGYISGGKGEAISVPSNAVYYRFTVPIEYASGNDVQIELGSTASEYVPYNPNSRTYTISLGDTYYSGQIDVVKGVLVADKKGVNIKNVGLFGNYGTDNAPLFYAILSTVDIAPYGKAIYPAKNRPISNYYNAITTDSDVDMKDSEFRTRASGTTTPTDRFYFRDSRFTTAEDFNAYITNNPIQIVYRLSEPIEIPLTPTVISSLLGNNTIWTDGDNLEVEYITEEYQPLVDLIQSSNEVVYSTDERKIGKWIDGDLYQKTIVLLPSSFGSGDNIIQHGVSGLSEVINVSGSYIESSNATQPLPMVIPGDAYWTVRWHTFTATSFTLTVGSSAYSNITKIYVTIRYTKTTATRSLSKSAPIEDLSSEDEKSLESSENVVKTNDTEPEEVNEK